MKVFLRFTGWSRREIARLTHWIRGMAMPIAGSMAENAVLFSSYGVMENAIASQQFSEVLSMSDGSA